LVFATQRWEQNDGGGLTALLTDDAVRLLRDLDVKGKDSELAEAAEAYDGHPYAVFFLGSILEQQYGGKIEDWEKVDPLRGEVGNLVDAMLEHWKEDRPLLDLVACSLGPAPVEILSDLTEWGEEKIRERLGNLSQWQLVHFDGTEVDQHAVVMRGIKKALPETERNELLGRMAKWWHGRPVPPNPVFLHEMSPLIRATEHALEAENVDYATDIFYTKHSPESLFGLPCEWLWQCGHLEEAIRLSTLLVEALSRLVDGGKLELRNDLAEAHTNRGTVYWTQGRIDDAVNDHSKALELYETLVNQESLPEHRCGLAMTYMSRGNALSDQGHLEDAVHDHDKALVLYETLVNQEGRREFRDDLARTYTNRGNAYQAQGCFDEAVGDYEKALGFFETLVNQEVRRELREVLACTVVCQANAYSMKKEWSTAGPTYQRAVAQLEEILSDGYVHTLSDFLTGVGNACIAFNDLGLEKETAGWVNNGLKWLCQEIEAGRFTEVLERWARWFFECVEEKREGLVKAGMDEELLERVKGMMKEE